MVNPEPKLETRHHLYELIDEALEKLPSQKPLLRSSWQDIQSTVEKFSEAALTSRELIEDERNEMTSRLKRFLNFVHDINRAFSRLNESKKDRERYSYLIGDMLSQVQDQFIARGLKAEFEEILAADLKTKLDYENLSEQVAGVIQSMQEDFPRTTVQQFGALPRGGQGKAVYSRMLLNGALPEDSVPEDLKQMAASAPPIGTPEEVASTSASGPSSNPILSKSIQAQLGMIAAHNNTDPEEEEVTQIQDTPQTPTNSEPQTPEVIVEPPSQPVSSGERAKMDKSRSEMKSINFEVDDPGMVSETGTKSNVESIFSIDSVPPAQEKAPARASTKIIVPVTSESARVPAASKEEVETAAHTEDTPQPFLKTPSLKQTVELENPVILAPPQQIQAESRSKAYRLFPWIAAGVVLTAGASVIAVQAYQRSTPRPIEKTQPVDQIENPPKPVESEVVEQPEELYVTYAYNFNNEKFRSFVQRYKDLGMGMGLAKYLEESAPRVKIAVITDPDKQAEAKANGDIFFTGNETDEQIRLTILRQLLDTMENNYKYGHDYVRHIRKALEIYEQDGKFSAHHEEAQKLWEATQFLKQTRPPGWKGFYPETDPDKNPGVEKMKDSLPYGGQFVVDYVETEMRNNPAEFDDVGLMGRQICKGILDGRNQALKEGKADIASGLSFTYHQAWCGGDLSKIFEPSPFNEFLQYSLAVREDGYTVPAAELYKLKQEQSQQKAAPQPKSKPATQPASAPAPKPTGYLDRVKGWFKKSTRSEHATNQRSPQEIRDRIPIKGWKQTLKEYFLG